MYAMYGNLFKVGLVKNVFLSIPVSVFVLTAVLALAYGRSMDDLTFVGMVGLLDPPRDGIQDAVLTLLSTGAHLKMVTGDSEETALAIGRYIVLGLVVSWLGRWTYDHEVVGLML